MTNGQHVREEMRKGKGGRRGRGGGRGEKVVGKRKREWEVMVKVEVLDGKEEKVFE